MFAIFFIFLSTSIHTVFFIFQFSHFPFTFLPSQFFPTSIISIFSSIFLSFLLSLSFERTPNLSHYSYPLFSTIFHFSCFYIYFHYFSSHSIAFNRNQNPFTFSIYSFTSIFLSYSTHTIGYFLSLFLLITFLLSTLIFHSIGNFSQPSQFLIFILSPQFIALSYIFTFSINFTFFLIYSFWRFLL